jgi:hypothetical protein
MRHKLLYSFWREEMYAQLEVSFESYLSVIV